MRVLSPSVLGCASYGWVLWYLVTGPAAFAFIVYIAVVDTEPCLSIGLSLQAIFILLAVFALSRRICARYRQRGVTTDGRPISHTDPVELFGADLADVQAAFTPRGGRGDSPLSHRSGGGTHRSGGGTHRSGGGTHRSGGGTHRSGGGTPRGGQYTPRGGQYTPRAQVEMGGYAPGGYGPGGYGPGGYCDPQLSHRSQYEPQLSHRSNTHRSQYGGASHRSQYGGASQRSLINGGPASHRGLPYGGGMHPGAPCGGMPPGAPYGGGFVPPVGGLPVPGAPPQVPPLFAAGAYSAYDAALLQQQYIEQAAETHRQLASMGAAAPHPYAVADAGAQYAAHSAAQVRAAQQSAYDLYSAAAAEQQYAVAAAEQQQLEAAAAMAAVHGQVVDGQYVGCGLAPGALPAAGVPMGGGVVSPGQVGLASCGLDETDMAATWMQYAASPDDFADGPPAEGKPKKGKGDEEWDDNDPLQI